VWSRSGLTCGGQSDETHRWRTQLVHSLARGPPHVLLRVRARTGARIRVRGRVRGSVRARVRVRVRVRVLQSA